MKRPGYPYSLTTTPRADVEGQLLGYALRHSSVALTQGEYRAVNRLYGYNPERSRTKPAQPELPRRSDFDSEWKYKQAVKAAEEAHAKWTDPSPFFQAGADRNAMRHAECDGLRMLVWIAKYVPAGEDPVKHLVQLASDAGWDVDPADLAWAMGEDDDDADGS